jgi:superoxide dismutase, Cu-Zn family
MDRTRTIALSGALAVTAGVAVIALPSSAGASHRERASATLRLADGRAVGTVAFFGDPWTVTEVRVTVRMPRSAPAPGFHGFHVHANADPANGSGCLADPASPSSTWFVSADGHLAETGEVHGQHAGDLPPLLVTDGGRAYSVSITDRVAVDDLLRRAVVLHARADNLGNVPVGTAPNEYTRNSDAARDLTERTGNAGDRLACGVITRR